MRHTAISLKLVFYLISSLFAGEFKRYGTDEFCSSHHRDASRRDFRHRKFRFTCLRYARRIYYLLARSTYKSVPRGVHRPSELQQLSPLGDSRCSYLNNIPNSLASLTRDSPASHHGNREYSASFSRDVSLWQRSKKVLSNLQLCNYVNVRGGNVIKIIRMK